MQMAIPGCIDPESTYPLEMFIAPFQFKEHKHTSKVRYLKDYSQTMVSKGFTGTFRNKPKRKHKTSLEF